MRTINADDLIEHLDNLCELNCPYTKKQRSVMCDSCFMGMALDEIDNMPTIDAEPIRHGKWIERKVITDNKAIEEWQGAKCSVCGKIHTTPYMYYFSHYDYCPNCGAKMDEVEP